MQCCEEFGDEWELSGDVCSKLQTLADLWFILTGGEEKQQMAQKSVRYCLQRITANSQQQPEEREFNAKQPCSAAAPNVYIAATLRRIADTARRSPVSSIDFYSNSANSQHSANTQTCPNKSHQVAHHRTDSDIDAKRPSREHGRLRRSIGERARRRLQYNGQVDVWGCPEGRTVKAKWPNMSCFLNFFC
jgi:hypothetical protein